MYRHFKRLIDIVFSICAIVILSPVFLCIALMIKCDSKGPVLFRQKRIGINRSTFLIYKFRTMRTDAPGNTPTHLLDASTSYITKIGTFLRKSSLDELPQFLNILNGKMSLVGPRPALWNQYDLIEEREKYNANSVRPGLTGWAQINGRDELPIAMKAKFDGEYIKRASFTFDVQIILRTIISVSRTEGIKEGSD